MQQDLRLDRQRAGDADALLHPARELARVDVLESAEADEVEDAIVGFHARCGAQAQRLERLLDVRATVSHGYSAKLWNTIETAGFRPSQGLIVVEDLAAGVRADQTRQDAHERRLAASRRTEHGQDLLCRDVERDVVEHAQRLARSGGRRTWRRLELQHSAFRSSLLHIAFLSFRQREAPLGEMVQRRQTSAVEHDDDERT